MNMREILEAGPEEEEKDVTKIARGNNDIFDEMFFAENQDNQRRATRLKDFKRV